MHALSGFTLVINEIYLGDKNNNVDLLSRQPQPEGNGMARAPENTEGDGDGNDV
jgi:hypothetical protein